MDRRNLHALETIYLEAFTLDTQKITGMKRSSIINFIKNEFEREKFSLRKFY